MVNTVDEFASDLEKILKAWNGVGQKEKMLLLMHHWLDSLACWSFEDFY